jgi:hypothetical protein
MLVRWLAAAERSGGIVGLSADNRKPPKVLRASATGQTHLCRACKPIEVKRSFWVETRPSDSRVAADDDDGDG